MNQTTKETRRRSYDAVLPKRAARCRLILETLGNRELTASEITEELIKTGYWSAATKEVLVQKLAAYENTGYEPDEIRAAIEQAAKNSETKTATIMAECIAGAMKDTLEKYGSAGSGK